jgi:hypothetical protein
MKILIKSLLAGLVLSGFILSCNEDEETDPLFGTWTLLLEITTNCTNEADNHYSPFDCNDLFCRKISFKSNNTFKVEETDEGIKQTINGTYQKDNEQITLCFNLNCDEPASYLISSDTLTISGYETDTGCTKTVLFTKY